MHAFVPVKTERGGRVALGWLGFGIHVPSLSLLPSAVQGPILQCNLVAADSRTEHALSRLSHSICLLVVVGIDDCLLPLAGLDLALEENVDLAVRTSLHLWQPPPRHGNTHGCCAGPDVTTLATEISTL